MPGCGAALLALYLAWPFVASAALLLDLSGAAPSLRWLIPIRAGTVDASDIMVPTRHGSIPARMYSPAHVTNRTIVIVPGIHAGGVGEPRLDRLATRLAGAGAVVLSVPIPDLRAYRITPHATDMIEDAVLWLSDARATDGTRVGLMGVSFSGGLAIVAAGRPALQDKLAAVVSVGGHGELPRALRYLCTGELPGGDVRRPHDYAAAILLRAALPKLVPSTQLAAVDRALVAYLDASSVRATEPDRADALLEESAAIAAGLEEPARSIMRAVTDRDLAALGPRLLPWIEELGSDPALSPERSAPPRAPVFLVHGLDDTVIPSTETLMLARHLSAIPGTSVQWLLTPLLSHADVQSGVPVADLWRLVRLWTTLWTDLSSTRR